MTQLLPSRGEDADDFRRLWSEIATIGGAVSDVQSDSLQVYALGFVSSNENRGKEENRLRFKWESWDRTCSLELLCAPGEVAKPQREAPMNSGDGDDG